MNKIIGGIAVIALLFSIFGLVGGNQSGDQGNLGARTPGTQFPHGVTIGATGSATNNAAVIDTTCSLIGTDASQAATSTVLYDCAVTGVTSSYIVTAQLATTTLSRTNLGTMWWSIAAAKASTTAGYVTVTLANFGSAATPSATGVGSSTMIHAVLTQ